MAEKYRTEKDWRRILAGLKSMPPARTHRSALARVEAENEARRRLREYEMARVGYEVSNDPGVRRMRDGQINHAMTEREVRRHLRGDDQDAPAAEDHVSRALRPMDDKRREAVWAEFGELGEDGGWAS